MNKRIIERVIKLTKALEDLGTNPSIDIHLDGEDFEKVMKMNFPELSLINEPDVGQTLKGFERKLVIFNRSTY